jgi:hypothetical protein
MTGPAVPAAPPVSPPTPGMPAGMPLRGPGAPGQPMAPPVPSPIARTIADLRGRVARGESILAGVPAAPPPAAAAPPARQAAPAAPAGPPAVPAAPPAPAAPQAGQPPAPPPAPHPATTQPRNLDGTFAPVDPNAAPVAAAPVDPNAPPVAAGEAPPEVMRMTIPGRRPGDPDRVYETDDTELYQDWQRLSNGYMRGEESQQFVAQHQQQMERERQDYQELRELVTLDPINFVRQHLNQEDAVEIGLGLLLQENLWPAILPTLQAMVANPQAAIVARSRLEADAYRRRDTALGRVQQQRQANEQAQVLFRVVGQMLPSDMPAPQRAQLEQVMRQDLAQYSGRFGFNAIPPEDVPAILASRLRSAGIDPVQAAARLSAPQAAPSPGNGARPGIPLASAQQAPPDGQQYVQRAAVRQVAAAAAPQGAGAPVSQMPQLPKGARIKDAANLLRQQHGLAPR